MAKPSFTIGGSPAAWGDLSEESSPMLGNLFAVSIRLPKVLAVSGFAQAGQVVSMLASAVELPEEVLEIVEVATKLSTYDVVVGKTRGELGITFKEQVGAPVSAVFSAWHELIVSPRDAGLGFPDGDSGYRADIWIAALSGDGIPYFWWGHKKCMPKSRGKVSFANDNKTPLDIAIPFSYLELADVAEVMSGEGANMMSRLNSAALAVGV